PGGLVIVAARAPGVAEHVEALVSYRGPPDHRHFVLLTGSCRAAPEVTEGPYTRIGRLGGLGGQKLGTHVDRGGLTAVELIVDGLLERARVPLSVEGRQSHREAVLRPAALGDYVFFHEVGGIVLHPNIYGIDGTQESQR